MTKQERKTLLYQTVFVDGALLLFCLFFLALSKMLSARLPHYRCVFLAVLGLYCPGCGGTRGVRHLFHFEFGQAFLSYPPLFFVFAVFLYYHVLALLSVITGDPKYKSKIKPERALLVMTAVIFLFFLARNIALAFGYDYLGDIL